jgi:PAS domain S-box-containing protein
MSIFARQGRESPVAPSRERSALEAALKVSDIAASAVALPEAVQQVVATALQLFAAEQSSIMLLDENGSELVLTACAGLSPGVPVGHRVPVGEGVAGRVLATGRAICLDDVDVEQFVNFVPKDRHITSSLVAPLRANGHSIGVLSLAISNGSATFNDDDRRLAQMFADQAAGLIYRTRLHERAEQRSSDLAVLFECSKGLLGTLNVDELLQAALDGAGRLAGEKRGFVCLLDPERGTVAKGTFRGMDKQLIKLLLDQPSTRQAIDGAELIHVTLPDGPGHIALGLHTSQGTKGLIVVPGSPDVISERGYVLKSFGQQCASALGSAELHTVIERKESELASIIQSVPNPIVLVDADGNIASLNPSAEHLFGISSAFCAGTPATGVIGNAQIEELLANPSDALTEVQIGTPPRYFKVRARQVRLPDAPMGRVLVMDDITPEREMAQTQHDFVAMIGHELRTPLTIVKGFARMLLRKVDTVAKEDLLEGLNTIDGKANQLERLIEDLLYVSKIEAREATMRLEPHDLSALIHSVASEILRDYPDREINLDLPQSLQWPCDETKVSLVVRHLLDNALKFSDAPNPVIVRAHVDGQEVQVDVIDKGVGIVSSDVAHIFDRFHQIDGSSTRAHGGTGVGLYVCRQLLKVHEGRIWVDSAWGKGSTFSFSLPRRSLAADVVNLRGRSSQTG